MQKLKRVLQILKKHETTILTVIFFSAFSIAVIFSFFLSASPPEEQEGFIIQDKFWLPHMANEIQYFFINEQGQRVQISRDIYEQYEIGDYYEP